MLIFAFFISIVAADLEIAPYTVIKEHAGWEEREMPALKWITTRGFCDTPHGGESYQSFYRLFDYIDGANSESVKIPMTAPVSHYIIPGDGPECVSNFTMSFFIPMDFQDNPPEPTGADVFIEQRAGRKVVANKFGGFPSDNKFKEKAEELHELAMAEGLEVSMDTYWTAGYDGPYVIFNRRNEVWLEKP